MSKIKMRCTTCGKWFQSANAKEVTCPDCVQKARKEKMAAKAGPPAASKPAGLGGDAATRSVPPPPKPKPAASNTSHWLDTLNDVKVGQPEQPPPRPKLPPSSAPRDNRGGPERVGGYRGTEQGPGGPGTYRDDHGPGSYREGSTRGPGTYREGGNRGPGTYRESDYRGPGNYRENNYRTPYRVGGGMGLPDTTEQRPRQPMPGGPPRGPRPGAPGEARPDKFRQGGKPSAQKTKTPKPKPATPPKPKREKIPPPAPFKPSEEQIAQVEARYLELAVPTEFDGIRTQISKELSIPKTAVKKIIKDLREREHIPSWWEAQTYKGSSEELEKIKEAYVPLLPLPPVGIHKQIAEQLSLKPGDVYQAIKAIRQEMNLPQYNDPSLHGIELRPGKQQEATEAQTAEQQSEVAEAQAAVEQSESVTAQAAEIQPTATEPQAAVEQPESVIAQTAEVQPAVAEPQATAEKSETATAQAVEQQPEVVTAQVTEEKPETGAAQAEEVKPETPASPATEDKQGSAGEVASIETDTVFHKVGDTTEVMATGSTDAKGDGEA